MIALVKTLFSIILWDGVNWFAFSNLLKSNEIINDIILFQGLPAVLVSFHLTAMVYNHSSSASKCWKGYLDMPEIGILQAPIVTGLLVNNFVSQFYRIYELVLLCFLATLITA